MSFPRLILMSGPPGAGKSTLARAAARRLRAVVLDKDPIDECFSPGDRGPRYTRDIEPKVLQALLNLAEENLRLGHTVILDVPWTHILLNSPVWRRHIRGLAKRTRSRFHVFEIEIPEESLRERLTRRGFARDRGRLTPRGWEVFRKTDCLGAKNPFPHTVIDSRLSVTAAVSRVLSALRGRSSRAMV